MEAMEKQMRAEREKRATIAESEGEMQSQINRAEGAKAAAIAQSEGQKQAMINQAEGEAAQIRTVATATAEGLRIVGDQLGNDGVAAAQLRLAEAYINEFGKLAKTGNSMIILGRRGRRRRHGGDHDQDHQDGQGLSAEKPQDQSLIRHIGQGGIGHGGIFHSQHPARQSGRPSAL